MKRSTFELDLMNQFCQLTLHLGIEIVPCRLLQRIFSMMLEKAGPTFSSSNDVLAKITKNIIMASAP